MTDWSDSGGDVPPICTDDNDCDNRQPLHVGRFKALVRIGVATLLVALASHLGHARDPDGRYAKSNPELKAWFDSLKSGKGPCCSDADGTAVSDVDWESKADITACGSTANGSTCPTKPWSPNRIESAEPWFGHCAAISG